MNPPTSFFGDAPPVWPVREDPGEAPLLMARGLMALDAGRYDEAVRYFVDAIKRSPGDGLAYRHLGRALLGTGAWEMAARAFTHALDGVPGQISALPGHVPALIGLGQALGACGRVGEALAAFERALEYAPDSAMAHFCRGNALRDLGQADAALEAFERSIALDAGHMPAHLLRGMILGERQRLTEALACFERALALHPQVADAHFGIGRVHESLGDHTKAGRAYTEALRIAPTHVPSLTGLSNALLAAKHYDLALAQIMKVEALAPGRPYVQCMGVFLARQLCRWAPLGLPLLAGEVLPVAEGATTDDVAAAELATLRLRAQRGEPALEPFAALVLYDDPALHKHVAGMFMQKLHPQVAEAPPLASGQVGGRLRVAYVSSDFYNHATAYLLAGVLEAHDKGTVEVLLLSYGLPVYDAMRLRLMRACDRWVDVHNKSDAEVAALCRELGVHIAVDLKGLTRDSRPGIFAHRAAPLQVNWLGYPGTLGAPYYDYMLADRVVIDEAQRAHYSEAMAYLPHSYQPNDDRRAISPSRSGRAAHGLPENGLVLCCFNNSFKITRPVWALWMRLLAQTPGSVLWLLRPHPVAMGHLREQAGMQGVDPGRLVFAPLMDLSLHLARLQLADLSLETLPYNAHTTASDALWAGVPHITCMGESFASRVGASLLHAVGMPELVTRSMAEYANLALVLLQDGARLEGLRARLASRRRGSALFDTAGFARHLERAFGQMIWRQTRGLAPADFDVANLHESKQE